MTSQITNFATKWISNEREVEDFLSQLEESPYADTLIRPLNLAHLCALFERYKQIPDKPKSVYRKVINLLVEEWDTQRGLVRRNSTFFFDPERKIEFISEFAFQLSSKFQMVVFDHSILSRIYNSICENYGLLERDREVILNELESNTGLIIKSNYESYEFAHISLQEYLTALYIVKLPFIPPFRDIQLLPFELAIAVSISSNPSLYLAQLVFTTLKYSDFSLEFIRSFFQRLVIEKPNLFPGSLSAISIQYVYTYCKMIREWKDEEISDIFEIFNYSLFERSFEFMLMEYDRVEDPSYYLSFVSDINKEYTQKIQKNLFSKEFMKANNLTLYVRSIKSDPQLKNLPIYLCINEFQLKSLSHSN